MRVPNQPARLNRFLLGLIGLILAAAGAFELATRFGALHWVPRDQGLAFLVARGRPGWVRYAVLAGVIIIGLAALGWLAAQASRRRPPLPEWRMAAGPYRGVTLLRSAAAAAPLAADVESYDGVRAASAYLTGPHQSPSLYLHVRTEYDTDLTALRRQIREHAMSRLRGALELDALPSVILITPTGARTRTR
jgi:hypothetical protein